MQTTPDQAQSVDSTGDHVVDPAARFVTPEALVADPLLTPNEKLGFLEQWALDLANRQAAASEGMVPDTADIAARDAALLRFVQNAIRSIENERTRSG